MKFNLSPWLAFTISALAILVLGYIDYVTGQEMSFSIFYMPAVLLCCWYSGLPAASLLALFAAATWFVVNDMILGDKTPGLIGYWNAGVRFGYFLSFSILLSEYKRILLRAQQLARVDFLTGLANIKSFVESFDREIARCQRSHLPITAAYIDCDNFKAVNDHSGHAEGDRLLKLLGETLLRAIRRSDIAARLGGDEFALLLPETDAEEARGVITRVREELNQLMQRHHWPVTFSIGVVTYRRPGYSAHAAIREADALMYSVKHNTKNAIAYRVFGDEDSAAAPAVSAATGS